MPGTFENQLVAQGSRLSTRCVSCVGAAIVRANRKRHTQQLSPSREDTLMVWLPEVFQGPGASEQTPLYRTRGALISGRHWNRSE